MRWIGIDLHKTSFVVCFLDEGDIPKLETHALTEAGLATFCHRLRPSDHLAVETAQNVYYFYERIRTSVDRIVLVDPYKFAVIAKSKKKTDRHDAITLARFLKLGWLPSVPIPSEKIRQLRILRQARENLVQMTTQLKNMGHAACTRNGVALRRAAFISSRSRQRLTHRPDLVPPDQQILGAVLRQLDSLEGEIATLDAEILRRGRDLPGLARLLQIRGLSALTAIILLAEITKHGRKRLRTIAIRAILAMVNGRRTPLMDFYARKKHEKGAGKALCAAARKLLTIIYVMRATA